VKALGSRKLKRALLGLRIAFLAIVAVPVAGATEIPADPLGSAQWETMYRLFLTEHPVVFSDKVRILMPDNAEDSLAVPVMLDASSFANVERVVVFADFNPIPKILEFQPREAEVRLGFRFKVQQATPVRAAVLSGGRWYVGGSWLNAAGGGCTLPSVASADPAWTSRLGEVHARLWTRGDHRRLKFSVLHPMDTGLAPGIPAFFIESLEVRDGNGEVLATLRTFEPISENPFFSLDVRGAGAVSVGGRDNNGNRFSADLAPPDAH
jgi:sulfur-oxidizing protein SoxY